MIRPGSSPLYRSEEEKIDFAHARKDVGARLFKEGRYSMAMERYKKIVDLFNYVDSYKVHGGGHDPGISSRTIR